MTSAITAVAVAPLQGHRRKVRAVAIGEFRERPIVVSGSNDNTVRAWDLDSGRLLDEPLVGHHSNVTAIAVGEVNGRAIAVSGSEDFTLRVWDLEVARPLGTLQGHEGFVFAVALGKLGGRPIAVSGGYDKTLRVWDLDNGEALGTPLRGHRDWVTAVATGSRPTRPGPRPASLLDQLAPLILAGVRALRGGEQRRALPGLRRRYAVSRQESKSPLDTRTALLTRAT